MNYAQMKKDELIEVLKQRDAAIAGFEETNNLLSKENDDLTVIVNDGSTDNTEQKILEYSNKYANIKYIRHSENKKPVKERIKLQ